MAIIQLNVNSTHSITLGYKGEHNADIIEVILSNSVVGGSIYLDLMLPDLTKTQTPALVDNKFTVPGDLLQAAGKGYIDVLHKKDGNVDVLCHCFLTVLDAVNASEELVPKYQDVISQWEEDEAERKESEALRKEDELVRKEDEAERGEAEALRKEDEAERKLAEGVRESTFVQSQTDRNAAYGIAEGVRNTDYGIAEGGRNTAYGVAEGVRNTNAGLAEGVRDVNAANREDARDVLYEAREDLRDTIVGGLDARVKATELQGTLQQDEINTLEKMFSESNPTQAARVSTISAAQAIPLPKTAGIGPCNVIQNGLTYTQLISNGQFSTTAGWVLSATASITGGKLILNSSGANASAYWLFPTTYVSQSMYIAMRVTANTLNGECRIGTLMEDSMFDSNVITYTAGQTGIKYVKVTTKATGTPNRVVVYNAAAATTGTIEIDWIMLVNLTADGLTALTDAQMYDTTGGEYISGTQSVIAPRLRSIGKNLYDKQTNPLVVGNISGTGEPSSGATDRCRTTEKIKVLPSTVHTMTVTGTLFSPRTVAYYTASGAYISQLDNASGASFTFTTPATCGLVHLIMRKTDNAVLTASDRTLFAETLMFERNATATTYEAYQDISALYTEPKELHRVPNDTKDTIEPVNGVMNYVQRVKRYVLTADDITALSTSNAGADLVITGLFADSNIDNTISTHFYVAGWRRISQGAVDYSTPTYVGFIVRPNSTAFRFIVAKGTYADLAAAKTALAGTVVYYQLATPVFTPISSSGVLQSSPSGTIYAEHVIADAGVYTDKFTITDPDFPIESLESLYKVDPITGVKTALAHGTATIAGDGESFTHAGLSNGDVVFCPYFYPFTDVWGQNVYSHFTGQVIADTANGKFYLPRITSTNGTAAIALTEVT